MCAQILVAVSRGGPANVLLRVGITFGPPDGHPYPGGQYGEIPWSRIEPDGRFASAGLFPRRYLMRIDTLPVPDLAGWSVGSIRVDGREVELIDVGTNDTLVEVTLTNRPTRLTGTVRGVGGQAAPESIVLVFSVDPVQRAELRPVRVVANSTGAFEVSRLRPGNYFAVAVASTPFSWDAPDYLASLAGSAAQVRIALGESRSADLTITSPAK